MPLLSCEMVSAEVAAQTESISLWKGRVVHTNCWGECLPYIPKSENVIRACPGKETSIQSNRLRAPRLLYLQCVVNCEIAESEQIEKDVSRWGR